MEGPQEEEGLHGMEQNASTEAWDYWLNEEFKLDSGSPMDISDCLWDNFAQSNDTVARSLFAGAAPSAVETEDSLQTSSSWHDPPVSMLSLLVEEHVNSSPCLSDSFKGCDDGSFATVCKDLPPSSNSMWFTPGESSLSSSPCCDDPIEQSAESWMARCLNEEKDVHAQGTRHCHPEFADHNSFVQTDVMMPRDSTGAQGSFCTIRDAQRGARLSQELAQNDTNMMKPRNTKANGKRVSKTMPTSSDYGSQVVQASSGKPIVYPFELVKPCGMQGDATLKDINERINMFSPACSPHPPCPSTCSPFSGKPVVAVTKIHTEGKGTITIMRTRS